MFYLHVRLHQVYAAWCWKGPEGNNGFPETRLYMCCHRGALYVSTLFWPGDWTKGLIQHIKHDLYHWKHSNPEFIIMKIKRLFVPLLSIALYEMFFYFLVLLFVWNACGTLEFLVFCEEQVLIHSYRESEEENWTNWRLLAYLRSIRSQVQGRTTHTYHKNPRDKQIQGAIVYLKQST